MVDIGEGAMQSDDVQRCNVDDGENNSIINDRLFNGTKRARG